MYFRLSRQDLAALRTGQELTFNVEPKSGERPLPPDVARGALQSFRDWRTRRHDKGLAIAYDPNTFPDGLPPAAVPEARTLVTLTLNQSELGQFTLGRSSGLYTPRYHFLEYRRDIPYAVGVSPIVLKPDNSVLNARFARDPALRRSITVRPQPSCRRAPDPNTPDESAPEAKVTSADVLEAVHRATGIPIAADYYTHLYAPSVVSVRNMPLFDALNRLSDAMRLRWNKEGEWLQLRSTSFYDDRLKEVPNRLLSRWAAARRQHGILTLDDLVEIAQLPDAQLDAAEIAEGARDCWGLAEWRLAHSEQLRPSLRDLVGFTPAQRLEMMSSTGLPFTKMSLAQQQGFLSHLRSPHPFEWPEDLVGATLRVQYTQPGWFTWRVPGPF